MRPTLVNGLALIGAVSVVSAACSRGGRDSSSSTSSTAAITQTASAATPAASKPVDSLAKVADLNRVQGSPTAKLWIVEVSDFQCPFCKEWHDETYAMVMKDYVATGKVRFAYVNFPLSMHKNAHAASVAAMCASAQGKFWPMHDALFASQPRWETLTDPSQAFEQLATSAGVNVATYRACLSSPSIESLIEGDQDRAQRGGVGSTPSFFIGSRLMEGAVPPSDMRTAIDQALAAAK